ncbi:retropepsin-like aspartic protease family protein [Lyngbya confervoides]|uniref:TIGR02281 family clan AA aspartic protease n=1 Tax=Lyngbya confervoides BDU141951 TaxID=1574623 RepID=A0ABD4T1Y1_9CYAN|nr:TIGR02281 family clan AA aspartic protease [Lyngbya confervoides]MCM1982636.1 TIGR02281 family clan AA aspartic protease [Lyngbya confervoides BDU141951]
MDQVQGSAPSSRWHPALGKFAIVLGLWGLILTPKAWGQPSIAALNQQLQEAVAAENWSGALGIIDQLIPRVPQQRTALEDYRSRLQRLEQVDSPPSPQARVNRPHGQVPIKRRENGVIVIDATFNGRQSYDMLLDSGASVTVITQDMARDLGIRAENVVQTATFSTANGYTRLPIVYLQSVDVGGLVLRQVPVAIAGQELRMGLLGQDFLQQYDVILKRDRVEFLRRP